MPPARRHPRALLTSLSAAGKGRAAAQPEAQHHLGPPGAPWAGSPTFAPLFKKELAAYHGQPRRRQQCQQRRPPVVAARPALGSADAACLPVGAGRRCHLARHTVPWPRCGCRRSTGGAARGGCEAWGAAPRKPLTHGIRAALWSFAHPACTACGRASALPITRRPPSLLMTGQHHHLMADGGTPPQGPALQEDAMSEGVGADGQEEVEVGRVESGRRQVDQGSWVPVPALQMGVHALYVHLRSRPRRLHALCRCMSAMTLLPTMMHDASSPLPPERTCPYRGPYALPRYDDGGRSSSWSRTRSSRSRPRRSR